MNEVPDAPAEGAAVFGGRMPLALRYAALLSTEGITRGLVGPREAARIWDRHLLNSAGLTDLIEPSTTVCDVGSGAGLPGLVVAIRRPDLRVTLVESMLRRTSFLEDAVATLALDNVEVVRARAEDLHGGRQYDAVTARAVAPLERLLAWAWPLVAPGGRLLAIKGMSAEQELEDASAALARIRARSATVVRVGISEHFPPTTVIRVEARTAPH